MALVVDLLLFGVACFVLIKSANIMVKHLPLIGSHLKMNEFSMGFILMAISTTLPEFFVGITSALGNNTALSLGNAIGSIIVNLTLVIGIVVLFRGRVKIPHKVIKRDLVFMLPLIAAPIVMMLWPATWLQIGLDQYQGTISRIEGLILLLIFIAYFYMTMRQSRQFHKPTRAIAIPHLWRSVRITAMMVLLLLASAHFVVVYGTRISIGFNVAPILIGLFLIALGTSLPELAFQLEAVAQGHEDLALGDLIGACVSNATLVLGATALITPVTANFFIFFTSAMFMLVIGFIFLTFAESEGCLGKKEGISLIAIYVLFVIIESYIQTLQ